MAWLSFGLPSKLTFKDKVGPKEVAIVGADGSGVGDIRELEDWLSKLDSESSSNFLAAESVGPGGILTILLGSEALLLVFWVWEAK